MPTLRCDSSARASTSSGDEELRDTAAGDLDEGPVGEGLEPMSLATSIFGFPRMKA
jgi:hypothetical protein